MVVVKDTTNLEETIPTTSFKEYCKEPVHVQDCLTKVDRRRSLILGNSYTYYGEEGKQAEQAMSDQEEVVRINERLGNYRLMLENTMDPENKKRIEGMIASDNTLLKRINSRLDRRDPSDMLIGKADFQNNQAYANGLDQLAQRIGEWFETGAVGPGTVTYRDKTFTAQ